VAISTNVAPSWKGAEQAPGQEMPGGLDTTVPWPELVTVSVCVSVTTVLLKLAKILAAADTVKAQLVPWQMAPPYPSKCELALAVLLKVMTVPGAACIRQVPGHLMPAGDEVTVPAPAPSTSTSTVTRPCAWAPKAAPTAVSADRVTSQPPVPEQAPLQPVNCMPAAGVAVRCTTAPAVSACEQVEVQLIDPSAEVTVPPPVTVTLKTGPEPVPVPVLPVVPLPEELPPQANNAARTPTPPNPLILICVSPL